MMLSDTDILVAVTHGHLQVSPFEADLVQPSSLDVRLGRKFCVFQNSPGQVLDPPKDQSSLVREMEVSRGNGCQLNPGEFVLGHTYETVGLDATIAAKVEGKSSRGRLGLMVHVTAGFIDPGFSGQITLELSNVNKLPIILWPGMKIGQLCFFKLQTPALAPYGHGARGSRYSGQQGPTISRSYQNFTTADL